MDDPKSKTKKAILFVMNVPPPFHGTTIMNSYLIDYYTRKEYPFIHLPVEGSQSHLELGKFGVRKLENALGILKQIFKNRRNFKVAYLIMSVGGFAFYRHALFILLLLLLNKKVVLHLRGLGFKEKSGFSRCVTRVLFKHSFLIQHTPFNKHDIQDFGRKKVFYIPNGWPDHYPKFKNQRKQEKTCVDVVFLSNLIESKGLFDLLGAIKQLSQPNCKFHFIGNWKNNDTRDQFYKYIESHNLTDVIGEVGPKYNDEKYAFLINMDILVFPTYYEHETWGNVNMEAMMFEIPVIATQWAGIPEMIKDGENGFLMPPRDIAMLKAHLSRLINDSSLRVQMGAKGREMFLEKFTLSKFESQMDRILTEVATH